MCIRDRYESPSVDDIKEYCRCQIDTLWDETLRFENPQTYYVDLSQKLWDIKNELLSEKMCIRDSQDILRRLVDIQYNRNDMAFERGTFRARGDVIDIYPAGSESAVRVELFGDEVESIKEMNPVTGEITGARDHIAIYPASHYVTSPEKMEHALKTIDEELEERVRWCKDRGKLLEACLLYTSRCV